MHLSLNGERVVMYARWESLAQYEAVRAGSGSMSAREEVVETAIFEPGVFDIVQEFEPPIVRQQVLSILDEVVSERNIGLVFISHDLNLVPSFWDRVIIMYAGRIVETVAARDLDNASHPYTRSLLNALPTEIILATAGSPAPRSGLAGELT